MKFEKVKFVLVGALAAVALAGCDPDLGGGDGGTDGGEELPTHVKVNFTVDATARAGYYTNGDLEWKGAFEVVDSATRVMTPDGNWDGPFPKLWDDGPVSAGGHEPAGATAGDNKFGVELLFARPTEEVTIEYGAQLADGRVGCVGGCWAWVGTNGQVAIAPDAVSVTADGLVLAPEGTKDLKLTLDTDALTSGFTLDAEETVKVKGIFSYWSSDIAYDDGTHGDETAADGVYTYVLSEYVGGPHDRLLLNSGTTTEFVWVIGTQEYKTGSNAESAGTGAATRTDGAASWTDATVTMVGGNTAVAIP